MTPLGCPDCLLIRYEPRALRARFRVRAIVFAFPSQACVARFFAVTFFKVVPFFFRMRNVGELQVLVVSRASNQPSPTVKSLMIMILFEYRPLPLSFTPSLFIEQSQLSINSAFCGEF